MATERQIAANRRNALKSTGPRSSAGKNRSSHNSYRHGLSMAAAGRGEVAKRAEKLARTIAGAGADAVILEQARSVAQAQLDLEQIRRMRVSLIQRMAELGEFDVPDLLATPRDTRRILKSIDRGLAWDLSVPAPSMPSSEPERSAEAMRRALPELLKLDRYERSAAARRDKAARLLVASRTNYNH